MGRLSLEIIKGAPQFVNPLLEREIDLHNTDLSLLEGSHTSSLKLPIICYLANFDTLNLSGNELDRLEGFPTSENKLIRVKTIHCHANNNLNKIQPTLGEALPFLHTLSFHSCNFSSIDQLRPLADVPGLRSLSLIDNPLSTQENYKSLIRELLPGLVYLDHCKLPKAEKLAEKPAKKGKKGRAAATEKKAKAAKIPVPSREELLEKLAEATDLDEVTRIEKLLKKHYS
mmetsp:Transcript_24125/g.37594  ORF Transcript_24125/g.37594 Transcript_24125/m.37594 type:complete len:229 (-) Transcript_24125:37-723(-)